MVFKVNKSSFIIEVKRCKETPSVWVNLIFRLEAYVLPSEIFSIMQYQNRFISIQLVILLGTLPEILRSMIYAFLYMESFG